VEIWSLTDQQKSNGINFQNPCEPDCFIGAVVGVVGTVPALSQKVPGNGSRQTDDGNLAGIS